MGIGIKAMSWEGWFCVGYISLTLKNDIPRPIVMRKKASVISD